MKPDLDLRLYAIADPAAAPAERLPDLVRRAIEGGATLVQFRDKTSGTRTLIERSRSLLEVTRALRVPLLINDRVDVALALAADGVHLGQSDMPADLARRLLGPDRVIGLTVRSLDEAVAVPFPAVDYVAIGGVFATASKVNETRALGTEGLRRIAELLQAERPGLPLCAIAGITTENAGSVVEAGVDGIAVISALLHAADVREAARALRASVERGLAERNRA